jgi:hypothetical protein
MDSYAMRRLVEVVYLCNVFRKTHGGPAPEGFPQLTSLIDAREIGGSDFYDTPGNAYDEFAAIARDGNGGLRDELFGHDDESGRALFQALDDSEHFLSSAMQWAAGVQTTTPPKLIAHGNRSYSIDGVKPIVVTSEENSVLQAFTTSKAAMTTKQLEKHVANVCRVMKRLDKRFPGAVLFPKRKGDGYYVNVCPHHVPTA